MAIPPTRSDWPHGRVFLGKYTIRNNESVFLTLSPTWARRRPVLSTCTIIYARSDGKSRKDPRALVRFGYELPNWEVLL